MSCVVTCCVCLCVFVRQVLGGRAGAAVAEVRADSGDEHSQHQKHRPSETGRVGHQTTLRMYTHTHTHTRHNMAQQCVVT